MADIDFPTFDRILHRCQEVATGPGADPSVARVYGDLLAPLAAKFRTTHAAIAPAESGANKERREALEALARIDQPYRKARAVARAYVKHLTLPDTLKNQPTDTDKMTAITTLLDELESRAESEPWAAAELAGEFGTLAPQVIRELGEWIAANGGLARARTDRSTAYGPTYDAYLAFKNVVRHSHGSTSTEYRRIHLRAGGGADDGGGGGGGGGGEGS